MGNDFILIRFGRFDGSYISQQQFWEEHANVGLDAHQQRRLMDNLEIQATKFLEQNWRYDHSKVKINGRCASFTFQDPLSGELYFKPLYKVDVRVFFKKMERAYLLVYDLRRVA